MEAQYIQSQQKLLKQQIFQDYRRQFQKQKKPCYFDIDTWKKLKIKPQLNFFLEDQSQKNITQVHSVALEVNNLKQVKILG